MPFALGAPAARQGRGGGWRHVPGGRRVPPGRAAAPSALAGRLCSTTVQAGLPGTAAAGAPALPLTAGGAGPVCERREEGGRELADGCEQRESRAAQSSKSARAGRHAGGRHLNSPLHNRLTKGTHSGPGPAAHTGPGQAPPAGPRPRGLVPSPSATAGWCYGRMYAGAVAVASAVSLVRARQGCPSRGLRAQAMSMRHETR